MVQRKVLLGLLMASTSFMAACGSNFSPNIKPSAVASIAGSLDSSKKLAFKTRPSANGALSLAPSIYENTTAAFTATGGTPPYVYSISGCDSTINADTGLVQAANDVSTCQLLVTDSASASATLTLQILATPVVSVPPAPIYLSETINAGAQLPITPSGGTAPYQFAVSGCDSTIDLSGVFLAAQDTSTCLVTVTDAALNTAAETINVVATASPLMLSSASLQVNAYSNLQFTVSGGTAPYLYSLSGCDSSIDSQSGVFTAAGDASTCVVQVMDSLNNVTSSTVAVSAQVAVQTLDFVHPAQRIYVGRPRFLQVSGGVTPYTFSVSGCASTVDAQTGLFVGLRGHSICLVTVQDASGATAKANIAVIWNDNN